MRPGLALPPELGTGRGQIKIRERQRFRAIEIDVDKLTLSWAKPHGNILAITEQPRYVLDCGTEILPAWHCRLLLALRDWHDAPTAPEISKREVGHGTGPAHRSATESSGIGALATAGWRSRLWGGGSGPACCRDVLGDIHAASGFERTVSGDSPARF